MCSRISWQKYQHQNMHTLHTYPPGGLPLWGGRPLEGTLQGATPGGRWHSYTHFLGPAKSRDLNGIHAFNVFQEILETTSEYMMSMFFHKLLKQHSHHVMFSRISLKTFTSKHTYIHTYVCTYVHTYSHACIHACIHTSVTFLSKSFYDT